MPASSPPVRYERLFDREHRIVAGGLLDERLDRVRERVVRVVQQDVAVAHRPEDVAVLAARERRRVLRGEGRVLQLRPAQAVEIPEAVQVERRVDLVHVVGAELELTAQQREHLGRDVRVDLEPHRETELRALPQRDLHRGEEILGLVAQLDVGVARHTERILREHFHAREQRVEVRRDHLFERHVARAVGDADEAREERRHLHPGESLFAARAVAHDHREVEREVRDVRERVRGVDRERGEYREDPVVEHPRQLRLRVGVEVVPRRERDSGVLEGGRDLLRERGGLARHQLLDPRPDRPELFDLVEAVRRGRADADRELLFDPGDAHLEELVDVAAEDREELRPLEER